MRRCSWKTVLNVGSFFRCVTSAATAAPVPTEIADETNHKCGRYYKAVVGDYCNLVIIKVGISLDDFVFLNPAINAKYEPFNRH